MVITGMQAEIQSIEEDTSLFEETNFNERTEAIDFIDFHIIDRIEGLTTHTLPNKELEVLQDHAKKVKQSLEQIDIDLFEKCRENIRKNIYRGPAFRRMIYKYLGDYFSDVSQPGKIGYDNLDVFINGLLSNRTVPEATLEREKEMVFYQKTPARIVLELASLAALNKHDVFVDIGSGLGQVVIMINLLCNIKAIGIEYEPAYCDYANACIQQLNLSNITFINADARNADYSIGSVFFLYTPFEGNMLQELLAILHKESQKRIIRIFTYGPCSIDVALNSWLFCSSERVDNIYKLYEFKSFVTIKI